MKTSIEPFEYNYVTVRMTEEEATSLRCALMRLLEQKNLSYCLDTLLNNLQGVNA